ncbi:uncharacterized protein TNCV_740301 [Trichonephila clavipes]|nr:uncharacterized protein TNCV_740301 [Trichonephila clavipes]
MPLRRGGTLYRRRAATPLVRLGEGEERWEASDFPQNVLSLNWGRSEPNRTVTCIVLKAKANDRRTTSPLPGQISWALIWLVWDSLEGDCPSSTVKFVNLLLHLFYPCRIAESARIVECESTRKTACLYEVARLARRYIACLTASTSALKSGAPKPAA